MGEITLSAAWAWVLAACSALILISNVAEKIGIMIRNAKAPDKQQDERIRKLEDAVEDLRNSRDGYQHRMEDSVRANRISQEAILALLGHAIDGNNSTEMKKARENLTNYLINH